MSWHFLQAGAVACWPEKSLDGAPSALLRLMPAQGESCLTGNATELLSSSRYGMTSEHSMADHGAAMSMSSAADSHARTSASAGGGQDLMENDQAYGWKWPVSFVKLCQTQEKNGNFSSSWKTRQCSLLGGLEEFSQTWPEWGWMRSGECSELPQLERPITEQGFSWLLTPTAQSWKAWTFRNPCGLIRKNHADGNLQEQLMRLYQRMTTPLCQEILMMWPEGWTASKPLATAGFQQWLQEQPFFWQRESERDA